MNPNIKYPKIHSLWKRNDKGVIIPGEYSLPEFESIVRWEFTEKIDGTNIRVMYSEGKIEIGGRTDKAKLQNELEEYLKNKFTPELMATTFDSASRVVLFGEGYGKGIQKIGKFYGSEQRFVLFDVVVGHWWLKRDAVEYTAAKLDIPIVPMLEGSSTQDAIDWVCSSPRSIFAKQEVLAEGLVAKSYPQMLFRGYSTPIMWKLKVRDYLALKDNE